MLTLRKKLPILVDDDGVGWGPAGPNAPADEIEEREFDFTIDDKQVEPYFVLTASSVDGDLFNDSWLDTLEIAYEHAEDFYGIKKEDWEGSL